MGLKGWLCMFGLMNRIEGMKEEMVKKLRLEERGCVWKFLGTIREIKDESIL